MQKTRIVIADDHNLFREGVRAICETLGNFEVAGEAENGREAVTLAKTLAPDIILMDINMPGLNGVRATEEIIRHNPRAKVIILTMFDQDNYVLDAVKAGAKGYILKDAEGEELVAAITAVTNDNISLPRNLAVKVLEEFRLMSNPDAEEPDRLTSSEMEVLKLVARGMDNRCIATRLNISDKTVSNRLSEIFSKLGVSNRTQAALVAIRKGWASLYPEEGDLRGPS